MGVRRWRDKLLKGLGKILVTELLIKFNQSRVAQAAPYVRGDLAADWNIQGVRRARDAESVGLPPTRKGLYGGFRAVVLRNHANNSRRKPFFRAGSKTVLSSTAFNSRARRSW